MFILAHRGLWECEEEKNSMKAIYRAFDCGMGIETDIRDYEGKLVISHNIADENSPMVEDVFKYYAENELNVPLALNIKADGLQELIKNLVEQYGITNYFLFDMSIPELVVNEKMKLNFFTRNSDIEKECVMYEQAMGVWMDSFYKEDWIRISCIQEHLYNGKKVCMISPEIHRMKEGKLWEMLLTEGLHMNPNVMLCTDKGKEAERFFEI